MTDWYTEALATVDVSEWPLWGSNPTYTGRFVDDFGTMIRVYQYFGDDTFVVESD